MVKLTYCGGIPEMTKPGDFQAAATPEWFEVKYGFGKIVKIMYQNISDVTMKTAEQIVNNATPLDYLLAGKMALAIKKKEITNYLVIDYDCGNGVKTSAIFTGVNVPVVHSVMLKQRIEYAKNNPQPASIVDVSAELQKFYELMKSGVITEDEFNAKKAQLLGV